MCVRMGNAVRAGRRARLRADHSITATRVKAATPSTITASSTASYRGSPSLGATRADIVITASSGSAGVKRAAGATVPAQGRLALALPDCGLKAAVPWQPGEFPRRRGGHDRHEAL